MILWTLSCMGSLMRPLVDSNCATEKQKYTRLSRDAFRNVS
jgi:hypothetical protein